MLKRSTVVKKLGNKNSVEEQEQSFEYKPEIQMTQRRILKKIRRKPKLYKGFKPRLDKSAALNSSSIEGQMISQNRHDLKTARTAYYSKSREEKKQSMEAGREEFIENTFIPYRKAFEKMQKLMENAL